ncbi:Ig-like domain-containing protein, partial [Pseudomonadota bacterium]
MRFSKPIALSIISSSFLLASCGGTDNNVESDIQVDRTGDDGFVAYFAPSSSVIPFPSNLLFTGTADLTLNIPVSDANDFADPQVALNTLDGFSTIAPMSTTFSSAIESSTLNAQTVHLYEVTLSSFAGAVTGVVRELTYGTEFVASLSSVDSSGKTIAISPLAPLSPKTSYMVAFTNGIQSTDGRTVVPDVTYKLAKQTSALAVGGVSQIPTLTDAEAIALEPLRQATNLQEIALAGQGISSDSVVLSWTFSTQSIGDVLSTVRTNATGTAAGFAAAGDTAALLGAGPGLASVYAGSLTLPYYLTNNDTPANIDPLNTFWQGVSSSNLTQFNTTPVKTSDETVPLLLAVPKTAKPGSGWPVVIFQHGITSDRTAMLAIADALASAGFAAVAIDMPLHGLAATSGLYSGIERTFDLDLVDNTSGAAGADGTADTSGKHYINLTNLVVTRDNVRQSVADLFALYESLATMDYDTGGADFDTNNVYFIGHSLGGMVGVPFMALETGVKDAVLGMPGSGIAK